MVHNQDTEDTGMAWYDDPITVIAVAVVIIFAAGIVIYAMSRLGKKPQPKKPQKTAGFKP